ncbi:3-dehydroquinate synthase II [Nocardia sp. NPDC051321]|uniref:3-dehydroquinate synthase II n=1 Tax=Nocardia sp. NPDC051321 TaxID=3364323 RepID=UPI0037B0813B
MTAELWADIHTVTTAATPAALAYARNSEISAIVLRPSQLTEWEPLERIRIAGLGTADELGALDDQRVHTLIADSPAELDGVRAIADGRPVGVRCQIDDADGMNLAASVIGSVDVLIAAFTDTTNIPLELLLARAQSTRTQVFKELLSGAEAVSVAGVLESGPAGLVVIANDLTDLDRVARVLRKRREERRELVPLEVVRAEPIGMGYRGCVDTTSLFGEDEGMIVGSTSAGGILVCAEVHYLPYMNLRPFRVNAGAVHSYVFGTEETAYITDLAAGESTCAVSADGRFREVSVGRVKVELRPLRLIAARHGDVEVNVFLQDDWHVRVMSAEGKPLNLTNVRPGTALLGHLAEPGRHVGIKVSEQITEY